MGTGRPIRKAEDTGGIAENVGWADTRIEVGRAQDESSCLRLARWSSACF